MMRIAVISTSFPVSSNTNSGVFVEKLVSSLTKHAHINVIVPDSSENIMNDGSGYFLTQCRYAPKSWQTIAHQPGGIPEAVKKNPLNWILLVLMCLSMFLSCLRVSRFSDVFHANWSLSGVIAGLAGRLTRTPVITTLRGSDVNVANGNILGKFILYICFKLSKQITAVNNDLANRAISLFPEIKNKITVIPNGIETRFLQLPAEKQNKNFNILSVCNLTRNKSIDHVLQALSLNDFNNIHFTIVGDGPEKDKLLKQSHKLGLEDKVVFTGPVSHTDIIKYYEESDIYIISSEHEGRSNAMIEAMASGLPVIATDIPGNSELIKNGENGLLYSHSDIQLLSSLIKQISSDTNLRSRMAHNSREFIKTRIKTWDDTALEYLQLFEMLKS